VGRSAPAPILPISDPHGSGADTHRSAAHGDGDRYTRLRDRAMGRKSQANESRNIPSDHAHVAVLPV
jgi:hypothetical protein